MADQQLRLLERKWIASRSESAETEYLEACARAGLIAPELCVHLADLRAKKAAKRKAAARKLRRATALSPAAGQFLIAALLRELERGDKAWEIQSHILLAIGLSGDKSAVPVLQDLPRAELPGVVRMTLAFAIVKLADKPIQKAMDISDGDNSSAIGALAAIAKLRPIASDDQIGSLVAIVEAMERLSEEELESRTWLAIACAGWRAVPAAAEFLAHCLEYHEERVVDSAKKALKGQYAKRELL